MEQHLEPQIKESEFRIEALLAITMTLVVIGIGSAFGLSVMGDIRDDFVTNTAGCNATDTSACGQAYNATADGIQGVAKIPSKLPLIATIVIAATVIGILLTYMVIRSS